MICDNTFSTGFWFWLGRVTAEVAVWGGIALFLIALAIGTTWWSTRSKGK